MPVFSLPSPYGIGTLGKEAYNFIDFLESAGQSYWQMLPVGPTSYGDSPYQSPSSFAGNPYFIDPDMLTKDGLLTSGEARSIEWGDDPCSVDYETLYNRRYPLLEKASERCWEKNADEINAFAASTPWLADYSLFMAVKRYFKMVSWLEWPDEDIRLRRENALARYREMLDADVRFFMFLQYEFYKQWDALKTYAHKHGVEIIGDLPVYVALDSADVWAEPGFFQLDERNIPVEVAGVPPDYFTKDGQLWGNPLYDYDKMAADGFGWWIRRVEGAGKLYDMIRIDHFRGFASYWSVPYGEKTAKNGHWVKGPGMALISVLKNWFPQIRFIAEDLGYPAKEVSDLLQESGWPGMKVLEFAFDHRDVSSHLPHTYSFNCICYSGTHDNNTLVGWKSEADPKDISKAKRYLGLNSKEGFVRGMIRGGMASSADLFIAQIQDYLELGKEARINTPGTASGNWTWRMKPGLLTPALAKELASMATLYGRYTKG